MSSFPTESNAQSGGYYLANLVSIGQYLESQGFTQAAAAGIAGTIAGESNGNPESVGTGGDGLIGWTPPGSGYKGYDVPTGDAQQDFDHQLVALMAYAQANSPEAISRGGVDLSTLMKETDPNTAASDWTAFEGPKVPGSDIRSGVVQTVMQDLNGYKPNSGYKLPGNLGTPSGGDGSSPSGGSGTECAGFTVFGHCFGATVPSPAALWGDAKGYLERAGFFLLGGILILVGMYVLVHDTSAGQAAKGAAKDAAMAAVVA